MAKLHDLFRLNGDISFRDLAEFILLSHEEIMQSLSALQTAVAAEDQVIGSAVTLIQGIAAQVSAAGVDPVALQAVVDDINTQAQALAAAVAANTPAAPGAGS